MASLSHTIDARKIITENLSITLTLTHMREVRVRVFLFAKIVKFAAFILGSSIEVVIDLEDEVNDELIES